MIEQTVDMLRTIFRKHQSVVLWQSGGKDSLILMHLCQPWRDRVVMLHNALDGGFEGQWENLRSCAEAWGFEQIIRTAPTMTYDNYVEQYGWPVEVVPTSMDGVTRTPYLGQYKASSWWFCTWIRSIQPLVKMTQLMHPEAVLTGTRGSDAPLFATGGEVVDATTAYGWMRYNPLHGWTTAQVWAYIDTHQIPLPPHYQWKRDAPFEWPDCKACTWRPEYLAWLQAHEPGQYEALMQKFRPTLHALQRAIGEYSEALSKEVSHA